MSNRNSSKIKKNNTSKSDKTKALRVVLAITTVLSVLMIMSVFVCLALGQKTACICCAALMFFFGISSCVLLITIVRSNTNNVNNKICNENSTEVFNSVEKAQNANCEPIIDVHDRFSSNDVKEDGVDECCSVKDINEYVQEFEKNEQILTIVNNFVASNECNIFALEYNFLPINKTKNVFIYNIPKVDDSFEKQCATDYIRFISKFSQENFDKNKSNLRLDCVSRDYTGTYIDAWKKPEWKEQFLNIINLFLALYHQNIIVAKTSIGAAHYAFLFLIYMAKKKYFSNSAKTVLESYGLSINDSEETIIDTLYNNDIEEEEIISYILASNSIRHDYLDIWNDEIDKLKQIVSSRINSIKEKEKIQRLLEQNQEQETVKFDINDVDLMSGAQFELFISYLFSKLGYATEITKSSGDQGIDIIAKKGNAVVAIQTKCYSKPVGNHAIMEAVAGAKYYNATKTMVVTNNGFTKSARELAQVNGVILWDRAVLKEKMYEINT